MPFVSQAQRRFMYAKDPEMARRFEKKTPRNKKLPEKKGKPIRKYYMNKRDGAHMMSAFDSAWLVLKAQSYPIIKYTDDAVREQLQDPEVREYLTRRVNFIRENINSPDPSLRAEAQALRRSIGPRTLDVLMQHLGGSTEPEVRAPPMPFYSSTDRGYDPEREMSMEETMGMPKPVKVNKPMPSMKNQDDDEDVDDEMTPQ